MFICQQTTAPKFPRARNDQLPLPRILELEPGESVDVQDTS